MSATRRSFLRGLASATGVATASTAYAQHVHPETAPAGSRSPALKSALPRNRSVQLL